MCVNDDDDDDNDTDGFRFVLLVVMMITMMRWRRLQSIVVSRYHTFTVPNILF